MTIEHVGSPHGIRRGAAASGVCPLGGEARAYKRVALFKQGELSQTVRDVLRRRGVAMSTQEVIMGTTAALGHDDRALPATDGRVRSALNYLCDIKKTVAKDYRGRLVTWALGA